MRASSIFSPKVPAKLLGLCSFASAVGTLNLRSALSGFWRAQHHIVNGSAMLFCRAQLTHLTQLKPYTHWSTAVLSPPTSSTSALQLLANTTVSTSLLRAWLSEMPHGNGTTKHLSFCVQPVSLSVLSPVLSMWQVVDFLFVFFLNKAE